MIGKKEKSLSSGQLRVLAESLSNIGVAWFAGGIVGPFFLSKNLLDIMGSSAWGLVMAAGFISFALWIIKEEKEEK